MVLETNSENKKLVRNSVPVKFNPFAEISATSEHELPTPIQILETHGVHDFSHVVEAITDWFQAKHGTEEYKRAYDEFLHNSGHFRSDENNFNERMCYFLDYFTFFRTLSFTSDKNLTPYHNFINANVIQSSSLDETSINFLSNLQFIHSAFEIIKVGQKPSIRDLNTDKKFEIKGQGSDYFTNFHKSCVFQGFVFLNDNKVSISNGIVIHDKNATKYIKKEIKNERKKENFLDHNFLFSLARKKIQFNRMKNLTIKAAYTGK